MKKTVLFLTALIMSFGAFAQVIDFESYELGEVLPAPYSQTDAAISPTAVVEADPLEENGQSLHIVTSDWNTYAKVPTITLPEGKSLADVAKVTFDIQFSDAVTGQNSYKGVNVFLGEEGATLIANPSSPVATIAVGNLIASDPFNAWISKEISFASLTDEALLALNAFDMAIGFNHSGGDYFLDNITFLDADGNVIPVNLPAPPPTIVDFESNEPGTAFSLYSQTDAAIAPTAIVEADPLEENGQSLHVVTSDWNTYVKVPTVTLPEGKSLADVAKMTFDIQFSDAVTGQNSYKGVNVFLGEEGATLIANPSSPVATITAANLITSDPFNAWISKEISFATLTDEVLLALNAFDMAIGFNHSGGDYFLDNITFLDADGNVISVEVAEPVIVEPVNDLVFDFDAETVNSTYPTIHGWGWPDAATTATVVANPLGDGSSLKMVSNNYDGIAYFNVTLDEGFTVADITGIELDSYFEGAEEAINGTVEMFMAPADATVGNGTNFNTYPVWLKTSDVDGSMIPVSAPGEWFNISITREQIIDNGGFNLKGVADFTTLDEATEFIFGVGFSIVAGSEYFLDNITINGVKGSKNAGTTGIAQAKVQDFAYGSVGAVQVNVEGASIFDFSGRLVTKAVVGPNALPAGLYIVKADGQAVKVAVK